MNGKATRNLIHSAPALLIGVSALVVLIGCGTQPPPDLQSTSKRFETEETGKQRAIASDVDVYLDGSQSMQGFVRSVANDAGYKSNFARITRALFDDLSSSPAFHVSMWKFTTKMTPVNNVPIGSILSAGFFDGADTPLTDLLHKVGETPNRISILITDLVQSERERDEMALAQALTTLGARGFVFELRAFRSSFNGSYFVEDKGHGPNVIKLAQDETVPGNGRPFYVCIFAPNQESLDALTRYIGREVTGVKNVFVAGDPGWQIKALAAQSGRGWSTYTRPVQGGMNRAALGTYVPQGNSPGPLTVQATDSMKNPVYPSSADRVEVRIRRANYLNGRFSEVTAAPVEAQVSLVVKEAGEQITVALPVSAPATGWDVYEVRLGPGRGNLTVPGWVEEWNADSDASTADGNRTLGLRLIVGSMLRSISEQQVFLIEYLATGRK